MVSTKNTSIHQGNGIHGPNNHVENCTACDAATQGENTMTTINTIPSNVPTKVRIDTIGRISLTVRETYDKPRKCGGCEKKRKVNLIEIGLSDGKVATYAYTQKTCADCYDALKVQVGAHPRQPTRMEREVEEILSQHRR